MNEKATTRISKFLSLVLRHQPQLVGLRLDENGWVSVDDLLQGLKIKGIEIDRVSLEYVVATNNKKRFAFNEDGTKIRASQGHSINLDLGYETSEPPGVLYHGTAERNVQSILEQGLKKGNRQHVHLSRDKETAVNVGSRHGKPVVFEVFAKNMHNDGHAFYLSANGVWLTEEVPAVYLKPLADKYR